MQIIFTLFFLLLGGFCFSQNELPFYEQDVDNASFKMVKIPSGTFLMGNLLPLPKINGDNAPAHLVELKSFYLAETELTKEVLYELIDSLIIWDFLLLKLSLDGRPSFVEWLEGENDTSLYLFPNADNSMMVNKLDVFTYKDLFASKPNAKYFCSPKHFLGVSFLDYYRLLFFDNLAEPAIMLDVNFANYVIKKLNEKTGKSYRLPTEAEWEYAASVGGKYKHYYNIKNNLEVNHSVLSSVAYYQFRPSTGLPNFYRFMDYPERKNLLEDDLSSKNATAFTIALPVKSLKPNDWGLYDMLGNMWELCADGYSLEFYSQSPRSNPYFPIEKSFLQVVRGGSYADVVQSLSLHHRGAVPKNWTYYYQMPYTSLVKSTIPDIMGTNIGLRLAHDE